MRNRTFAAVPDLDAYLAQVRADNEGALRDRAVRQQALTDPALQCHHGVSLYDTCRTCGVEAGELSVPTPVAA
ncbi:hypothetical protein [Nocardioides pakistanensis]